MNKYESVIILSGKIEEEQVKKTISEVENFIKEYGYLESTEDIGKRQLAYEIKGNKEGWYVVFNFESNFGFITKLEDFYRKENNIIKFICYKKEE